VNGVHRADCTIANDPDRARHYDAVLLVKTILGGRVINEISTRNNRQERR
jgi:hypothetical protein